MRAVFFGTPESAVPTLESLIEHGHDVPLVVSRPDRPLRRSSVPEPPPVKRAAEALGLEIAQPTGVRSTRFAERLASIRPDVLVVVAYGRIFPRAVLDLPRWGPVNVHFSLLPRFRGAAPVQWALARGERTTGVTTMRMSEGLDEGDVLLQESVDIAPGVHAPELLDRLAGVGAGLLLATLERIDAGTIEATPQDPAAATYAPMLRASDGEADFRMTAPEIEGRIRGFDPWPGVWARSGGRRVRLVEATAAAATGRDRPGEVVAFEGDALRVACGGGTVLAVARIQPEGRRVLTARDAVNGRQLRPGDRFDAPPPTV